MKTDNIFNYINDKILKLEKELGRENLETTDFYSYKVITKYNNCKTIIANL